MTQDNFKWTDELVMQYADFFNERASQKITWASEAMQDFKASHSSNVERDWEIISCKRYDSAIHDYVDGKEGGFECLKFGCSIHSVLRKSDGVVFTVGDTIKVYRDSGYKGDRELLGFEIQDVVLKVVHEGSKSYIHQVQPLPQRTKLFTTEDGVDIFGGDDFWMIFTTTLSSATKTKAREELLPLRSYQKTFSTEEKAQEYIALNKPCLSVADVFGLWCIGGKDRERLKELAKSKLK